MLDLHFLTSNIMGKGTDNVKYREMEVNEGVYIPEYEIEYPEDDSGTLTHHFENFSKNI